MSDTTSKAKSDAASLPSVKCGTKFTMKGLEFYAKTCQEKKKRTLKCKQAKRYMEQVRVWMKSTDKVNSVQSERGKFTQSYEEANDMHECFLNLNLPED